MMRTQNGVEPAPGVSGGQLMAPSDSRPGTHGLDNVDWRQGLGALFIAIGFVIIVVAWYGASGTNSVASEFSYAISGGIGGGAAVIVGAMFLISYEHYLDRGTLAALQGRIEHLEVALATEFDHVLQEIHAASARTDGASATSMGEPVARWARES
ncbi:MAG: hypothetical protein ACYCV7_06910 [Acidimicrobiales bacterium]